MSDIVIRAENLGKSYIIGHEKRERYTALRDVLTNKARQIAGKTRQIFKGGQLIVGNELEEFWALKDLNFEIHQGDRVGIIGRNGAGKSTLLKVLSRITEPTTGKVHIKGRVASLLEVGTGFHPELTGRENIFLNGAILGMSQAEIKRKFDEIVDFSGVEKFLDTPVKRYSSGMYVRLAFAVAANLEPEILVIDEVLAVGDAEFQKKCLGKMEDVSKNDGRTVLFVSHNLSAIKNLCSTGCLLSSGMLQTFGDIDSTILKYQNSMNSFMEYSLNERTDRSGNGLFRFTNILIKNKENQIIDNTLSGEPLWVELYYTYTAQINLNKMIIAVHFCDEIGQLIGSFISDEIGKINFHEDENKIILKIPSLMLRGGKYFLKIVAAHEYTTTKYICDNVDNATSILVFPVDFWKSGKTNRQMNSAFFNGNFI